MSTRAEYTEREGPVYETIDQWCAAERLCGRSPLTIRRRRLTLTRVADFTGQDPLDATWQEIERWLADLDVQPHSRGYYLSDLRAFYGWAIRRELRDDDPTARLDQPKRPKYLPRPIPTKQLQDAIARAPERLHLMLTLAGYAGLRAAEIAGLRHEDIDHDQAVIRIRGKGSKVRIVPLHPRVAQVAPEGAAGPVVHWRGRPVSPGTVSANLAKYLRGVGVDATGHQARHSFGTRTYAACRDLAAVQEIMGHASPVTTRLYVAYSPAVAAAAVAALD